MRNNHYLVVLFEIFRNKMKRSFYINYIGEEP